MAKKEETGEFERRLQMYDPINKRWRDYAPIETLSEYEMAKCLRDEFPGVYRIIRVKEVKKDADAENR